MITIEQPRWIVIEDREDGSAELINLDCVFRFYMAKGRGPGIDPEEEEWWFLILQYKREEGGGARRTLLKSPDKTLIVNTFNAIKDRVWPHVVFKGENNG